MTIDVDVFLCTHNPRLDILTRVINSLSHQTLDPRRYRVTVIDNASTPPISKESCFPLTAAGIQWRLIVEEKLGNAYARARAFKENEAPFIVFVDDDTELDKNYLAKSLGILSTHPEIGCLGGKLLLAPGIHLPQWLTSIRSFLAIRDNLGEIPITEFGYSGMAAEPPSAGMAMRSEIGRSYLNMSHIYSLVGRRGRRGLRSMEDNLITRQAADMGFLSSYQPELRLYHHIDPSRFRFWYVFRLLYNQGVSEIILERNLSYQTDRLRHNIIERIADIPLSLYFLGKKGGSFRAMLCITARNVGLILYSLSNTGKRKRNKTGTNDSLPRLHGDKKRILIISPIPTHPQNTKNRTRLYSLVSSIKKCGYEIHFLFDNHQKHDTYTGRKGDTVSMGRTWDYFFYVAPTNSFLKSLVKIPYTYKNVFLGEIGPFIKDTFPIFFQRMKRFSSEKGIPSQATSPELDTQYNPTLDTVARSLTKQYNYDAVLVEYTFMSRVLNNFDDAVFKLVDTATNSDTKKHNEKILASLERALPTKEIVRPTLPLRGVYFLANDIMYDMTVAFLNSFRKFNPTSALCLIPYDSSCEQVKKLATMYQFSIFNDVTVLDACDGISAQFHSDSTPHTYRKLSAWHGPFDEFIYIDVDTVVLSGINGIFEFLLDYDYLASHSNIESIRKYVWKDSALNAGFLSKKQLDFAANMGFFCSRKSLFDVFSIPSIVEKMKPWFQHMELTCTDQALMNYLVVTSNRPYTSLLQLAVETGRTDIPLEIHADKKKGVVKNGLVYFKTEKNPILIMHWAGWSAQDTTKLSYRDLWMYYRHLRDGK